MKETRSNEKQTHFDVFLGVRDIYEEFALLAYLKTKKSEQSWTPNETDGILQCAKRYVWEKTYLLRILPNGNNKIVPKAQRREKLIRHAHEKLGYFGVKRTHSLLQTQFWLGDAKSSTTTCCEMKSLGLLRPQLQPLPIMGLGYRWSLHFARPIEVRHNKYV